MLLLTACAGSDDAVVQEPVNEELPMSFTAAKMDEENVSTRAAQQGATAAEAIGGSFAVYGVKLTSTTSPYGPQTVFSSTPVKYTSGSAGTSSTNTAGWDYVDNTTDNPTEFIRYWDQAAEGYTFFAFAPATLKDANDPNLKAKVGLNGDNKSGYVTIDNLKGGSKAPTTAANFSQPTVINPRTGQIAYQGAATMTFLQPLARIRIGFISGEDDYRVFDTPQHLAIRAVSFSPLKKTRDTDDDGIPDAKEIITNGSVTATYKWENKAAADAPAPKFECDVTYQSQPSSSTTAAQLEFNNYGAYTACSDTHTPAIGAHYSLNATQYVEDALYAYASETTGDVTALPATPNPEQIEAWQNKQWYYVFPQEAAEWQLSIKTTINGIDFDKTAVVPATYMRWLPNHQYTYVFKVTPETLSIVGVDIKVIDWNKGGTTEQEQHHW